MRVANSCEHTGGFPFYSPNFSPMGVGIASWDGVAAYFDMEYMMTDGGNYDHFLVRYKEFLDKYEEELYTYNINFEQRVTYLLFKKVYFFREAGTLNKLDGVVYKNMSLKWTAMKNLYTPSWDNLFEILNDKLGTLMGGSGHTERGKWIWDVEATPKDKLYESETWIKLMENEEFKPEEEEFKKLIGRYYPDSFGCIPSNILGKYCCMDAFNTVLLREVSDTRYSDACFKMFDDNMRLGSLLQLHGAYVDIETRDKMAKESAGVVAWGQAEFLRCYIDDEMKYIDFHGEVEVPELSDFLKAGYNPLNSKDMLQKLSHELVYKEELTEVLDDMINDGVIDEEGDFSEMESEDFEETQKEYTEVIEFIGHKATIDKIANIAGYDIAKVIEKCILETYGEMTDSMWRGKKCFNRIETELKKRWGYKETIEGSKFTIESKDYEFPCSFDIVIKYYDLKSHYDVCTSLAEQIDPDNPEWYYTDCNGKRWNTREVPDYCGQVLNINSQLDVPFMRLKMFNRFKAHFMYCKSIDWGGFTEEKLNDVPSLSDYTPEFYDDLEFKKDIGILTVQKHALKVLENHRDWIKGKFDPSGNRVADWDPEVAVKAMEAWKRYQKDGNLLLLIFTCNLYKVFNYIPEKYKFLKTADRSAKFNSLAKKNTVLTWYGMFKEAIAKSEPVDDVAEYIKVWDEKRAMWFMERNMKFFGMWTLTEQARDVVMDNLRSIDITGLDFNAYMKMNIAFLAARKYEKVLGTYLDGQFKTYNWLCNEPDENGICTKRYAYYEDKKEVERIKKEFPECNHVHMFSPMNVCEKRSKRWSGSTRLCMSVMIY